MTLVIAFVGFLSVVAILLVIGLTVSMRRLSASVLGIPTPKEKEIALETQQKRMEILKESPNGVDARRLTDAELERSINSRYDDQ